jgi:hypothetical protein
MIMKLYAIEYPADPGKRKKRLDHFSTGPQEARDKAAAEQLEGEGLTRSYSFQARTDTRRAMLAGAWGALYRQGARVVTFEAKRRGRGEQY